MSGRLTWDERLDEIQRRLTEEVGASGSGGLDNPYFDRTLDIEPTLLEVSNAALRVLPIELLGNPKAITTVSGASPVALPLIAIRLVSAVVDNGIAVEVEPAQYALFSSASARVFSISRDTTSDTGARGIRFNGTTGSFRFLCEQPLGVWQSTIEILPPGYDERTIAETVSILSIADNKEF